MKERLQTAIYKEIAIGGKFFCRHDWTFLVLATPLDAGGYYHLCVKCGKRKEFYQRQIEPLKTN